VPKTGIVLNNTMDDFAAQVGAKNLFGAVGGKNNLIAPLKTPLSSMSPTIVLKDGKPALALGAPGGTQIITCVAQTLLNVLEYGLPLYESVANPRFHHQWQPDEILFEAPGPGDAVIQALQSKGHHPRVLSVGADQMNCRVMAVAKEANELHAVSDPRDAGSAAAK
jgi:gamma-glutamyltranspeptidase/glutathione hydrolase